MGKKKQQNKKNLIPLDQLGFDSSLVSNAFTEKKCQHPRECDRQCIEMLEKNSIKIPDLEGFVRDQTHQRIQDLSSKADPDQRGFRIYSAADQRDLEDIFVKYFQSLLRDWSDSSNLSSYLLQLNKNPEQFRLPGRQSDRGTLLKILEGFSILYQEKLVVLQELPCGGVCRHSDINQLHSRQQIIQKIIFSLEKSFQIQL